MAKQEFRILDSDIHVIEPPEVWSEYLDPAYRDRAPVPRHEGTAWLEMDGMVFPAGAERPDRQRGLKVRYLSGENLDRIAQRGEQALHELVTGTTPGGMLEAMDVEGVDVAVCFRTQAAHVIAVDGMDPAFAAALCRAFNRWMADFCIVDPDRLRFGAQIPLHDVGHAVKEAQVAVTELGATTLVLPSHIVDGRPLYHPDFDALWATAAELDVAVSFHGIQSAHAPGMLGNRYHDNLVLGHAMAQPVELMACLGAVITGGVAARHPAVRFAFLEGNCGWLAWWLYALDERWKGWGDPEATGQHELPSELFARQCWLAMDVDEPEASHVMDVVGDDNIVLSTDWPHDDSAFPHAIEEFLELGLAPDRSQKILWDNCARLYGLDA